MGASFFDIAGRIIIGLIRSEHASRAARYVARQAAAAVIKDIRRRQAISRRTTMHIS